jgi:hypothetical protein
MHGNNIQWILMQLLFLFDRGMIVEKTLMQTLASQLSFPFDQGFVCSSCIIW